MSFSRLKAYCHLKSLDSKLFVNKQQNVYNHHFGLQLCCIIPMSQPAIFSETPSIQLPTGGEGCTVGAPAGNVPDTLGFQSLYQPRLVTVPGTRLNYTPFFFEEGKKTSTLIYLYSTRDLQTNLTTKP